MVAPRLVAPVEAEPFRTAFAAIRREFEVPDGFPTPVLETADRAAQSPPGAQWPRRDARDVPLVTIDPAGSRDLDQAFFAARRPGGGTRVSYAIADVAAFVTAGDPVDAEAWRRGVTIYLPDGRAPMLPEALCEGAASLLPDADRPAILWTFDLDGDGNVVTTTVERATVRSRAALSFDAVQQQLDAGTAGDVLVLLREVGMQRHALAAARGAIELDLPSQEVHAVGDGTYALDYRAPLPAESWNAQISLLTGIEAARIMIAAGVGVLRTLPPVAPQQLARLQRSAQALGVAWPPGVSWADVVAALDRTRPGDAAFLVQATHVLRGASYERLDANNTRDPSTIPQHAGVGAPYAHVTAPMRRLVDRYANEIVVATSAGRTPPAWATDVLDALTTEMRDATHRAAQIDRAAIDAVEVIALAHRIGDAFDAVVVDRNDKGSILQLRDPAVVASVAAPLTLGAAVSVRVDGVDPVARRVSLSVV